MYNREIDFEDMARFELCWASEWRQDVAVGTAWSLGAIERTALLCSVAAPPTDLLLFYFVMMTTIKVTRIPMLLWLSYDEQPASG
jgi:hypothetical protein